MQDEIHVWQADLNLTEQDASAPFELLDEDEKARALRFTLPHLRTRFIAAHAFVRQVIGQALGIPAECVRFDHTSHGKPYLLNDRELRFNLSHSADLAAMAIARNRELGIDIEHRHELLDMLGVARRFFAPAEVSSLLATAPEKQAEAFFTFWTGKEAYVKARGEGLAFPLERFHVLPVEGSELLHLEVDGEPTESDRWRITRFRLSESVFGALAAEALECPTYFHVWKILQS